MLWVQCGKEVDGAAVVSETAYVLDYRRREQKKLQKMPVKKGKL